MDERQNKNGDSRHSPHAKKAANESRAAELTALFGGSIVDFFCAGVHRRGVFEAAGYCALIRYSSPFSDIRIELNRLKRMAVSDLLNRRVRALPEEDEEVYSEAAASESESDDEKVEESGSDLGDDSSEGDYDAEVSLPKPCARPRTFLRVIISPTTNQMPRATKTRKMTRRTKTATTAKTTCKHH